MSSDFSITMDASALGLDELLGDAQQAARPAAQAGAQVFYDAVKDNVRRIRRVTGNLESAIYQAHIDGEAAPGVSAYRISWNKTKAPHGHLVEFGFLQRYEIARDARGRMFPMVRPEMADQPKPKRSAPQSVKDAYYVPRKGGPKQIAGKGFLRSAASRAPQARAAMRDRWFAELQAKGHIK